MYSKSEPKALLKMLWWCVYHCTGTWTMSHHGRACVHSALQMISNHHSTQRLVTPRKNNSTTVRQYADNEKSRERQLLWRVSTERKDGIVCVTGDYTPASIDLSITISLLQSHTTIHAACTCLVTYRYWTEYSCPVTTTYSSPVIACVVYDRELLKNCP